MHILVVRQVQSKKEKKKNGSWSFLISWIHNKEAILFSVTFWIMWDSVKDSSSDGLSVSRWARGTREPLLLLAWGAFWGTRKRWGEKKKLRSFQRVSSLDQTSPRNSANVEQRECYVLFMFSWIWNKGILYQKKSYLGHSYSDSKRSEI